MDLGPYLACDGVNYECTICDRYFCSEFALYTHCRQTSRHQWCERCLRAFVSAQAKNTHLRKSSRHNVCSTCPQLQDFATGEELQDHLVKSHHFCPQCNVYYNSVEQLQEHDITQHHLCVKCGDYFANKNNLQMVVRQLVLKILICPLLTVPFLQHQQKHQPRNLECYGCYQNFKSFSGMLIHLESGSCASDTTEEDINDIAHDCYQSRKYINDDLKHGGWLYRCPSCEMKFPKLSALYQHAEDVPPCSSPLNGHGCLAKLERFVARRLQ
jgi:protein-arginine kinase activator protein McsA